MIDRRSLKKYQKYLLSLAALTTVTVPVATIIHFGTEGFGTKQEPDQDGKEPEPIVLELKNTYQTKLKSKPTLDFEIGQSLTLQQAGVSGQIALGQRKVKLQIVDIDDQRGQIRVNLLDAQTNQKVVDKVILVRGFLTSSREDILSHLIRKIQSAYQTSWTNQTIEERQIIANRFVTLEQLGVETKIIFNLRGAQAAYIAVRTNVRLGAVRVRVELKWRGVERSKEFQVTGFLPTPSQSQPG